MKKKITLLIMAALLAVGGVQAGTKTVRKYLRLTDANITKYWNENDRTSFDYPTNTVNAADITEIDNHGNGNIAVGWDFDSNKCIGNYTKLVVNVTSQTNTNGLNFVLSEDGYWNRDAKAKTWKIEAGENKTLEINLTETFTTDAESNTLNVSNVNMICFVTEMQTSQAMSLTLGEVYLEKEVDDETYYDYTTEPFDFTNLTYMEEGKTTFDADTYTFSFTSGSYGGWQWDTPQNWNDYKYLVVIPQNQWSNGDIHCSYVLEDNASHVIDDAIMRWGEWNRARAAVLDLTTVTTTVFETGGPMDFDITNITKFYFRPIWGATGNFGVAAVYLTNQAPVFGENHDGASGTANYKREYTVKDKWGTVCLPYNAAVCGAEVYEVVGVNQLDGPTALYLENTKYMMEAGKSYVFNNTQDDANTFHLSNVTFYQVGEYETNIPTGKNLKGTFTGADVPNGSYILKNGKWKMSTGTAKVNENRAYLTLTESLVVPAEEALAKGFITMNLEDGTATGIGLTPMDDVESSKFKVQSSMIYNLAGQRMSKLQKGVNIVNGKKVLVK